MYAEALSELAKSKYDESKILFEEILKNDENNVLIKNNSSFDFGEGITGSW